MIDNQSILDGIAHYFESVYQPESDIDFVTDWIREW